MEIKEATREELLDWYILLLDAHRENVRYVNELEKENKKLKETLEHRDSFFSIMRDVLANEDIPSFLLEDILRVVVKWECWVELSDEDKQIYDKFWNREYV